MDNWKLRQLELSIGPDLLLDPKIFTEESSASSFQLLEYEEEVQSNTIRGSVVQFPAPVFYMLQVSLGKIPLVAHGGSSVGVVIASDELLMSCVVASATGVWMCVWTDECCVV